MTTPIALPVAGETADYARDYETVGPFPLKANAGIQIFLATNAVAIMLVTVLKQGTIWLRERPHC